MSDSADISANTDTMHTTGRRRGFYDDPQPSSNNKDTPFVVGFDVTTTEEQEKRKNRLHRFLSLGADVPQEEPRMIAGGIVVDDNELASRQARLERFIHTSRGGDDGDESGLTQHQDDIINGDNDDDDDGFIGHDEMPLVMYDEQLDTIPSDETTQEQGCFDPSALRRRNVVHLFGSRMLYLNWQTKHVIEFYKDYGVLKVEWQSDYRCNLVFSDEYNAKRFLYTQSRPNDLDVEVGKRLFIKQSTEQFSSDDYQFLVWRQATDELSQYNENGCLVMRMANVSDIKAPLEKRVHSAFYLRNQDYFKQLVKTRQRRHIKAKEEEVPDIITTHTTTNNNNSSDNNNNTTTTPGQDDSGILPTPLGSTIRGRGFQIGNQGILDPHHTVHLVKDDEYTHGSGPGRMSGGDEYYNRSRGSRGNSSNSTMDDDTNTRNSHNRERNRDYRHRFVDMPEITTRPIRDEGDYQKPLVQTLEAYHQRRQYNKAREESTRQARMYGPLARVGNNYTNPLSGNMMTERAPRVPRVHNTDPSSRFIPVEAPQSGVGAMFQQAEEELRRDLQEKRQREADAKQERKEEYERKKAMAQHRRERFRHSDHNNKSNNHRPNHRHNDRRRHNGNNNRDNNGNNYDGPIGRECYDINNNNNNNNNNNEDNMTSDNAPMDNSMDNDNINNNSSNSSNRSYQGFRPGVLSNISQHLEQNPSEMHHNEEQQHR